MQGSSKKFSKEKLHQIEDTLSEETEFAKEYLRGLFDPPKTSPLKSIQQQLDEQDNQIDELMVFAHRDTEKAVELFLNECLPEERLKVEEIFFKAVSRLGEITGKFDAHSITLEECECLEEIAKRKLIGHDYYNGSHMYRFIIQLNGFFSEAWVGWALCEQELGNWEAVDLIYQMALEFMPYDYYIILFAADFYISINRKEKAIAILEKGKQQLITDHLENSQSFKEIQESLKSVV